MSERRSLIALGVAALAALAILIGLGTWQLQRLAWKEDLIRQIQTRAHGEPGMIVPTAEWPRWTAGADEFRRVRATGAFLHEHETPVHGLAPGQRGAPAQGYYLMTPLRLADGAIVMVNRGFVPTELRGAAQRPSSQPPGEVTITGLVRAPETRTWFTPTDRPEQKQWFTRDPVAIAGANGLSGTAPFYIEADATPNPGGWPRGGQFRLDIPNNHLNYALTWFGIALTLIGVFATFAWRNLRPVPSPDGEKRTGSAVGQE